MWQEILSGFATNLQPTFILTMFIGTAAGTIIGAMPGLSSISAVALLLPFTFTMDPAQGLVMLGAVYMSAEFGGSIPAILMGTPGTSGAAATVLDGYPLTKRGEAMEALYLQLFAGAVGGTLGALVLLFFTPTLARWSLLIGPPEYFWLAIAGLVLVATLSGRNVIGGLIGVTLGLMLTLPGQDAMTGYLRFTFGDFRLTGGVPIVPAMLGLFAVGSILELLEQKTDKVAPLRPHKGVIRHVLGVMRRSKLVLAWTSIVGTVVGVVPGVGSAAASFAAYAEGKRISKDRDNFGKGSYDGVIAPETANNAVIGGSLVTLLGLGIPGSPPAAIMYGALTVHGILAGPRLFSQRADVAYTFMTGLLLTVVAMVIFGLITVRLSARIVRIPISYVVPAVLALAMIGTFGLRNNLFDVFILVSIGIVGYGLQKVGISWVAIALGLVLGRLAESSIQQAALIAPTRASNLFMYMVSRPFTVVLMLIVAFLLISGIRQTIQSSKLAAAELAAEEAPTAGVADAGDERAIAAADGADVEGEQQSQGGVAVDTSSRRGPSLQLCGIVVAVGLLGLGWYVLSQAAIFPQRADDLPQILGWTILILATVWIVFNVHPRLVGARGQIYPFAGVPWGQWSVLVVGLVLFANLARTVGFYECAFVFMLVGTYVVGRNRRGSKRAAIDAVIFSVGFTLFLYAAFRLLLGVRTPAGLFL